MLELTDKDADFVANVARKLLKALEEDHEEVNKKIEEIYKKLDVVGNQDPEYVTAKTEAINNLEKIYLKEKAEYTKIIELMMVGSQEK